MSFDTEIWISLIYSCSFPTEGVGAWLARVTWPPVFQNNLSSGAMLQSSVFDLEDPALDTSCLQFCPYKNKHRLSCQIKRILWQRAVHLSTPQMNSHTLVNTLPKWRMCCSPQSPPAWFLVWWLFGLHRWAVILLPLDVQDNTAAVSKILIFLKLRATSFLMMVAFLLVPNNRKEQAYSKQEPSHVFDSKQNILQRLGDCMAKSLESSQRQVPLRYSGTSAPSAATFHWRVFPRTTV